MAATNAGTKVGEMRILKTKVGNAILPNRSEREEATSDIYVKTPEGKFVAVKVKGQATTVGEGYVYLSVMKPISILAKINSSGDRGDIINEGDDKAIAVAQEELKELITKPSVARGSSRPSVPDEFKAALEKAKKSIEVPAGYYLTFDKNGDPVYKRKKAVKA